MYGIQGRSWVSMGDPVGPWEEQKELIEMFRQKANSDGGWPVFYQVCAEMLPVYRDIGLEIFKIGEEARVPLTGFSLSGSARRGLRRTVRRIEQQGGRFEVSLPPQQDCFISELRQVSDTWLREKNAHEKRFSLGFFDEAYLRDVPIATVRFQDQVVAFANIWLSADHEEISVDLMRQLAAAPSGIMEYVISQLMSWGSIQGYRWFDLRMAPLAGLPQTGHRSRLERVGALAFRHGSKFYNFQGIRRYKEKFRPVWEPRYLAAPPGLRLPRVVLDIPLLISGGLRNLLFH